MSTTSQGRLAAPRSRSDEVSLVDFYRTVVDYKWIFVGVVASVLAMVVLYLLVTPSVYEARARLLWAKPAMMSLSTPDHPLTTFDPKVVFNDYQAQLKLSANWRDYVEANLSALPPDLVAWWARDNFEPPIKLAQDKLFPGPHVELVYEATDPVMAADVLRKYLDFVRGRYVAELVASAKSQLEQKTQNVTTDIALLRQKAKLSREDNIERLRSEIAILRETAVLAREDEVARLKEDLALAKSLGITNSQLAGPSSAAMTASDVATVGNSVSTYGYLRGVRALESELSALEGRKFDDPYIPALRERQAALAALVKRESDDPFIDGLRDLEIELARVNQLQMTPDRFRPYMQDGEIDEPMVPTRPRKALFLVVGLVFGICLALGVVFSVRNAKRQAG